MPKTKTEVQEQSIALRLSRFLQLEDRLNSMDRGRRWSAAAMKREALKHYPEARLRALREEIDRAPDPGTIPTLIRRIQRDILASPHYMQYVPPSKADHILTVCMHGNREAAEHDLNRFKTDVAEVYALAVLEAAEDPESDCFGANDDPARTEAEMAEVQAKMQLLRDGFATGYTGDDVAFAEVLAGGQRLQVGHYKVTGGAVPLGAAQSLIDWARTHRRELEA